MQQEELHEKCTVCKRHMQALWIIHWFQLLYLNCITKSRLMHTHKYACMRANKYALLYLPYALPASMCIKIYQPRQRHMHKKSCVLVSSRSPTFEGTYVPTRVHPRKQPHRLVSCQSLQHCQGIFPPGSSGSSDRTNSGAANFHSPLRFFSQALTCRKHWKQKNGAQISKGFSLQWKKKINKGNGLLWHTAGEVCLTSKLLAIPQCSGRGTLSAARGVRREPGRGGRGAPALPTGPGRAARERRGGGAKSPRGGWRNSAKEEGCGREREPRQGQRERRAAPGAGGHAGIGVGAAAQSYPWRCRSCCGGLASPAPRSRRKELRTRRSSASKLSTTGLPRATGPKKAACGACGPAGCAMLGSARPGPVRPGRVAVSGQRPRAAAPRGRPGQGGRYRRGRLFHSLCRQAWHVACCVAMPAARLRINVCLSFKWLRLFK